MSFYNDGYFNIYLRIAAPFLGFVSGGIIQVVTYDVYSNYFKKIPCKYITLKRIHNFSAYLGLTLGLSVLYRGKPLLVK